MYLGSWKLNNTVTFTCNTHYPPTSAAGDADALPYYGIYEDETATPILTGTMALFDAVNTNGFYSEQITLSSANGFEKGKSYNIRISAMVSGTTGALLHFLQIKDDAEDLLTLDWNGITGTASRSVLNALRFLRNKWYITGTTLFVTEEDDATEAWNSALTSDASADPVTGSDPT